MLIRIMVALFCLLISAAGMADDKRIYVELPPMMREHMLANMRDHLLALQTITQQLANQEFDQAADTAEQRLGMSSLERHGASHMGNFMPRAMGEIGTGMHLAASRFAVVSQNAAVDGGLKRHLLPCLRSWLNAWPAIHRTRFINRHKL